MNSPRQERILWPQHTAGCDGSVVSGRLVLRALRKLWPEIHACYGKEGPAVETTRQEGLMSPQPTNPTRQTNHNPLE